MSHRVQVQRGILIDERGRQIRARFLLTKHTLNPPALGCPKPELPFQV